MWTRAPIDDLLPGIRRIAETMPEEPAHFLWMNWSPPSNRPDMAFSVEDKTYLALYGGWKLAADDEKNIPWATDRMREMAHLSTGYRYAMKTPDSSRSFSDRSQHARARQNPPRSRLRSLSLVSGKTMNHPHPETNPPVRNQ
ncbi:MAG: hypothetical protein U0787_04050 [Polyangia bacterium]